MRGLRKDEHWQLAKVQNLQIQPRGRRLDKPDTESPQPIKKWLLADRLVYGLVNVRTDGERIAMAVMKENRRGFHVESFDAD